MLLHSCGVQIPLEATTSAGNPRGAPALALPDLGQEGGEVRRARPALRGVGGQVAANESPHANPGAAHIDADSQLLLPHRS